MNSAPQANELADRLDQVLPPDSQVVPDRAPDADSCVDAALRLARGPHPVLENVRMAQIQTQVLLHADRLPRSRNGSRRGWSYVLRWTVAACLLLAVVVVGTTGASAQSLPGDTLYPVKRWVEQGQLVLTGSDGEVSLRLDFAERRLNEFEELLERGDVRLDVLDDATDDMNVALRFVSRGIGPRNETLGRLVDLSERQVLLAQRASRVVGDDPAKLDRLNQRATEANEIANRARDMAVPSNDPQSRLPDVLAQLLDHRLSSGDVRRSARSLADLLHDPHAVVIEVPLHGRDLVHGTLPVIPLDIQPDSAQIEPVTGDVPPNGGYSSPVDWVQSNDDTLADGEPPAQSDVPAEPADDPSAGNDDPVAKNPRPDQPPSREPAATPPRAVGQPTGGKETPPADVLPPQDNGTPPPGRKARSSPYNLTPLEAAPLGEMLAARHSMLPPGYRAQEDRADWVADDTGMVLRSNPSPVSAPNVGPGSASPPADPITLDPVDPPPAAPVSQPPPVHKYVPPPEPPPVDSAPPARTPGQGEK
jgi:hypothetical protein